MKKPLIISIKTTQQEAREREEKTRKMWAAREARWTKFKKGK